MTDFRIRIAPTTRLLGAVLLMASAVAPALAADPEQDRPRRRAHHHDPVGHVAL